MTEIYLLYSVPLALFAGFGVRWYIVGRDPSVRKKLPLQFAPPKNIRPAEAGTLIDEKADNDDLIGTILDLAIRKNILIHDHGGAFDFELVEDFENDDGVIEFEKQLLRIMFGRDNKRSLETVKIHLLSRLWEIKQKLYKNMQEKGWYTQNPDKIHSRYAQWGGLFFILGIIIIVANTFKFIPSNISLHASMSLISSSIIIYAFAKIMPRRTKQGHEIYEHMIGLHQYLLHPGHSAPTYFTEQKESFEKLLPYAIIFGCLNMWLTHYNKIAKIPPHWYRGSMIDFNEHIEKLVQELA